MRSWFLFFGIGCLSIFHLPGAWVSLGIHISIKPAYVDLHIGWWIISIMSVERGEDLREADLVAIRGGL